MSLSNGHYGLVNVQFGGSGKNFGVCDHNFDLVDAHTICKTLGYTRASNYRADSYYGYQTYYGMTDLDCNADSQSLDECQFTKVNQQSLGSCRYVKDHVGVTCVGRVFFILKHHSINI